MQTKATVLAVEGKYATVMAERNSACEGCHKAAGDKGCSVCSLLGGERKISARAYNPIGAVVGDTVTIESKTGRMLWYAALVFLFPILLALLGGGIAGIWTDSFPIRLLAATVAFLAAFAGIYVYSRVVEKKSCDIEITQILTKNEQESMAQGCACE